MRRVVEHEGDDILMLQSMRAEHLRGAVRGRVHRAIVDRLARFGDDDGGLVGMGTRMDGRVHRASSPGHCVLSRMSSVLRSEEHTSELQSLMRISYAVFCLKKKKRNTET